MTIILYGAGGALSLADFYKLLGFRSVLYDQAVFENGKVINSHVINLVKIGDEWYPQDVTYNLFYIDRCTGDMMCFKDILSDLSDGNIDYVEQVAGDNKWRSCFFDESYEKLNRIVQQKEDKFFVYMNKDTYQLDFSNVYHIFKNDGYGENSYFLFCYPHGIYDVCGNLWESKYGFEDFISK